MGSPNIRIGIESNIILTDKSGESRISPEKFHESGGVLGPLIGLTVKSAERRDDGGLALTFTSGMRMEIVNDSPKSEALQLHIGGEIFVA